MASAYVENIRKWLEQADVDYIGPFVKAWLAFNAWYRSVYTHRTDREILDDLRWNPNVVRNHVVPLLVGSGEEAEQLRDPIGHLHHRLERYHIHSQHRGDWERITFTSVFLRSQPQTAQSRNRYRCSFAVTPGNGNPVPLTVTIAQNGNGNRIFNLTQNRFDIDELQRDPDFQRLTPDQRGTLLSLYRRLNPRLIADLTNNGGSPIRCGAYDLHCSCEDLFAGLCEIIYSLRCCLFHGELVPDREAIACYEPAYRIVRRFLASIS